MALTLDQIRTFVRSHLDLEADDLPNTLLDQFVREGSKRVEHAEPRWPFYESFYIYTADVNAFNLYAKVNIAPGDLDQVAQIQNGTFGPLKWIGYDALQEMQSARPNAVGRPLYYAEWAGYLVFWPVLDTSYTLTIRGYRKPKDWVADGAGGTPDLPDELHNTVQLWALSKAYAQQEDPELASLYERQFSDELNEYRRRLVMTPLAQPLVLNDGALRKGTMLVRPKWGWEVD